MDPLSAYLPVDRLAALARDRPLPEWPQGAALFADISGFTPLTEALARTLGVRRGAEELTVHLNRVYDALIHEVHRRGGSVIAFAGDAITCWFEGDDGRRATAAGLALQAAMHRLDHIELPDRTQAVLALKAAIAAGPARRLVVGHPEIQQFDVLAGRTLEQMGAAAHVAQRGEVLVAGDTARQLGPLLEVADWRGDAPPTQAAQIRALTQSVPPCPWPAHCPLPEAVVRPWILPAVFRRLREGQGEFLTELRPAVALFLKFGGIDFDHDPAAGQKLDAFVRWVQQTVDRYEGFLLDLSFGDKGCYLYGAFGAPVAHEDDPWRALSVALLLRSLPPELGFICDLQIGLSHGTMRTGAYGSATRRTYGVLGDEVNLAARLMDRAAPQQILVSESLQRDAAQAFEWEPLPPFEAKGKRRPIQAFALLASSAPRGSTARLVEPGYTLPLVGRAPELALLHDRLERVHHRRGQVVGITAEAGMGKSRLVAEFLQRLGSRPLRLYASQCASYGTNTSYLVWWPIWQEFFALAPSASPTPPHPEATLAEALAAIDPVLLPRLPLLGAALNLPLADNDVTRGFDAKLRKASLESLLIDCLRHRARHQPVLILLDDYHWIDPLSRDLAAAIARATTDLPVLLLITYRPHQHLESEPLPFASLPHFTEIRLADLAPAEAEQFLRLKTGQVFGPDFVLPAATAERLIRRSQGNPFYLEELLNLLRDQHASTSPTAALEHFELPATLQSLILSRIDRLPENQKDTLRVASVVGRVFPAPLVVEVHPLRHPDRVHQDLETLRQLDLTPLERTDPELTYLFKHIVTQEVTYESIAFATRATLHDHIGGCLESRHAATLDQFVDLLAHHYDRSTNLPKKRDYLLRAGEAAQTRYANSAALSYYQRALPLLDPPDRVEVLLKLGRVFELVGRWDDASQHYQQALALVTTHQDRRGEARCWTALGELLRKQGAHLRASEHLTHARTLFLALDDVSGVAETLHIAGTVAAQQGRYEEAVDLYHDSLRLRIRLQDHAQVASLLSNLGIIAWFRGDLLGAQFLYEGSLVIRRRLGDRRAIANSLNNLGLVARDEADLAAARRLIEESLALSRELGDRWAVANTLSSLADVALAQADHAATLRFLSESLEILQEIGDRTGIAFILETCATLAASLQQAASAIRLAAAAQRLRETLGTPLSPAEQSRLDLSLAAAAQILPEKDRAACEAVARTTAPEQLLTQELTTLRPLCSIGLKS